jgi:hypothetical protein
MAHQIISHQQLKEIFNYKDGNLYKKNKNNKKAGSKNIIPYDKTLVLGTRYYIHRLIFLYHYGFFPQFVDHIDGNPTNNKIENLREANSSQNMKNQKIPKDNTSGVKNVCWHKKAKKWCVQLRLNGKKFHIGLFQDLELAELIAIEARNKYYGEWANHS